MKNKSLFLFLAAVSFGTFLFSGSALAEGTLVITTRDTARLRVAAPIFLGDRLLGNGEVSFELAPLTYNITFGKLRGYKLIKPKRGKLAVKVVDNKTKEVTAIYKKRPGAPVVGIAADRTHSLVNRKNGRVSAWGYNLRGELGNGTNDSAVTPVDSGKLRDVKAVATGYNHSIALQKNGRVWAWGSNDSGRLGDGTITDRAKPVRVVGLSGVITAIAGGMAHTVALKEDGTVWAWGFNENGQLGDGTKDPRNKPVKVVGLSGKFIKAIAAGESHSIALESNGKVWAWGLNRMAQLGNGSLNDSLVPVQVGGLSDVIAVAAGPDNSGALKSDGTVWMWGSNTYGQIGSGTTGGRSAPVRVKNLSGVKAIDIGRGYAIALKNDGTVWTWGLNAAGQLGNGYIANKAIPVQTVRLTDIIAIAAGNQHSIALQKGGKVWGWGLNTYGQLGDASTETRLAPVKVKNL